MEAQAVRHKHEPRLLSWLVLALSSSLVTTDHPFSHPRQREQLRRGQTTTWRVNRRLSKHVNHTAGNRRPNGPIDSTAGNRRAQRARYGGNRPYGTSIDDPAGESASRHTRQSTIQQAIENVAGESTIRRGESPPSGPTNNTVGQSTANQGCGGPIDETACQSTKRWADRRDGGPADETMGQSTTQRADRGSVGPTDRQ